MAAKKKSKKKTSPKMPSPNTNSSQPHKEVTEDNQPSPSNDTPSGEPKMTQTPEKKSPPKDDETKAPTPDTPSHQLAYQERSLPGLLGVTLRGACMGGADVIPGVSGGTMALILGIYRELIASIRSFDLQALKLLFKGDLRGLSRHINLPFLLFLGAGIAGAIITLAKIIPKLLAEHPAPVHGLFFGLILASIAIVWNQVEKHDASTVFVLIAGAIGSYFLVGMIPLQTPSHLGFIFLSGSIAIIAMILPGISGAFILLLLGKYAYILETLRHVVHQRQLDQQFVVVVVFASGCAIGLLAFSRFLNWLLENHHALTLAVLSGFMLGSLRRIWPFQSYEKVTIGKKVLVKSYTNFWPSTWSSEFILAIILVFVGMLTVYTLHFFAQKRNHPKGA